LRQHPRSRVGKVLPFVPGYRPLTQRSAKL
jgi:hypothetical protein